MRFYASLGNHDEPNQRFYKGFNMNGERYYTSSRSPTSASSRSTALHGQDTARLADSSPRRAGPGKIVFSTTRFTRSGGRSCSDEELRVQLEPCS